MIYVFDLDNTLCILNKNKDGYWDYRDAKPIKGRIKIVNQLYRKKNTIIINTARGCLSGVDWYKDTEEQLNKWGVKYHKLIVGKKMCYDFWIDDKAINSEDFFGNFK